VFVAACPAGQITFNLSVGSAAGGIATTVATATAASVVAINAAATRMVYQQVAAGGLDGPLRSVSLPPGTPVEIDPKVADGEWIAAVDRSTVFFRTIDGTMKRVPFEGGAATTIASNVDFFAAVSPTNTDALVGTRSVGTGSQVLHDAALLGLAAASSPRSLQADTTTCLTCLESPFTSDGKYALYIIPVTPAIPAGPLVIAPMNGGPTRTVGTVVTDAFAISKGSGTGSATSAIVYDEPSGPERADFDIGYVDATKPNEVKLIAQRSSTGAWFFADQTRVAYSFSATQSSSGLYVTELP
jgi:hypothetical protein